jgi:luciferase family oxidoreductase group 1
MTNPYRSMTDPYRIPLSALDAAPVWTGTTATQALRHTIELAERVEQLGYLRFWVAEHHNLPSLATAAPAVLVGAVASATSTIRVGSGGVMLPNHPPLIVAEQFGTLEALYPGRIDLGIGRAPGTGQPTARLLRRGQVDEDLPALIAELDSYFAAVPGRPGPALQGGVSVENRPPMVLLGSSPGSAQLAGSLGLAYAYAHHINPAATIAAVNAYYDAFKPSARFSKPHLILAAMVFAAETDSEARALAEPFLVGQVIMRWGDLNALYPSPEEAAAFRYTPEQLEWARDRLDRQVWGSPDQIREQISELTSATSAKELMAVTMVYDQAERLRSYEVLASAVGHVPDRVRAKMAAA